MLFKDLALHIDCHFYKLKCTSGSHVICKICHKRLNIICKFYCFNSDELEVYNANLYF